MKWTESLARGAWDAGNRSMRAAGREHWNEDDWDAMCSAYNKLWPLSEEDRPEVQ